MQNMCRIRTQKLTIISYQANLRYSFLISRRYSPYFTENLMFILTLDSLQL